MIYRNVAVAELLWLVVASDVDAFSTLHVIVLSLYLPPLIIPNHDRFHQNQNNGN